ncbi:PBAN-type neuropeptides-like [Phymastichus coffea]|uniref:PBAN-type neuropeptides-like n=1 Tax=Phymastichus coffea TaxID=108790 RepID=UPI00273B4472|nr:PBAN-type neuropeptides-like [Phymastichus coffea]
MQPIDAARTKVVACVLLVFVVASQATGQYDGRSVDGVVEGPRVERMHPEVSSDCMGSNCLTQNSEGPVGAMWFGPRLGRRRRSEYKYSPKKLEALSEILASPNYGFTPDRVSNDLPSVLARSLGGDDKRQDGPFTPRLGRELEEAVNAYGFIRSILNRVDEPTDKDNSDQQQPPPMFPPRLGRNLRKLLRQLQM